MQNPQDFAPQVYRILRFCRALENIKNFPYCPKANRQNMDNFLIGKR
jgi:hypothetical protein